MPKNLRRIANRLSENDIQEIIRLKKMGDKKVIAVRKERDRVAANLAKLDAQLAKLTGERPAEAAEAPPHRRAGNPGRPKGSAKGKAKAKKTSMVKTKAAKAGKKITKIKRDDKKGRCINLSATVQEIFARAGEPLKANQIVDALPEAGIPVASVAGMRKRISVVLASQKNNFKRVKRGLYHLKK